jgi:hypothetical protein
MSRQQSVISVHCLKIHLKIHIYSLQPSVLSRWTVTLERAQEVPVFVQLDSADKTARHVS